MPKVVMLCGDASFTESLVNGAFLYETEKAEGEHIQGPRWWWVTNASSAEIDVDEENEEEKMLVHWGWVEEDLIHWVDDIHKERIERVRNFNSSLPVTWAELATVERILAVIQGYSILEVDQYPIIWDREEFLAYMKKEHGFEWELP